MRLAESRYNEKFSALSALENERRTSRATALSVASIITAAVSAVIALGSLAVAYSALQR
jgi:hypothetical protein